MNLHKINHYIDRYSNRLSESKYDGLVLWELAHQFQSSWEDDTPSLSKTFRNSFMINSPLWNRDGYMPKKMMERYIDMNDDLVRTMFNDLFNESREITGRISRFIFQCDEFYKIDRAENQIVMPHFHDDKKMIFLYLSFRYPEKYALYEYPLFRQFMEDVGSKSVFDPEDIDRFVKVCRTISMLAQKNKNLMQLVNSRILPITSGNIYPMLLVFEIYSMSQDEMV